SIAARPRYGSSARAVARTSSSNNATSTSRRGAAASRRRATAWPTRPQPPSIMAVRSRRSMQSLDGVDLARREPAVLPLLQPSQPHRPIRHAVQPLDLEPERLGEAPHDALAPLGERELQFDAPPGRPLAELRHPHGPAVDSDALPPGVDAHAERRDLAVHAHAARANQLLGLAPRRHARARQGALQAHHRHSGSVGAGGRSATDNSSSRGSSSRSLSPRISKNWGVVPYSSGRPSPSPRVTTSTSPRSSSLSITAPESTPRISSTSTRPTGWRYAMMASVSSAAGEIRRGRMETCARSRASPY